jgi:hypothetical protein
MALRQKILAPDRAMWAHGDVNGFSQRVNYLPLTDADIVVRAIERAQS